MAKRNTFTRNSGGVTFSNEPPNEIEESVEPIILQINLPKAITLPIVLLQNVNLKITGAVSGNLYEFYGAGYVVEVDERDIPAFLAKTTGRPCCSDKASPYFRLV